MLIKRIKDGGGEKAQWLRPLGVLPGQQGSIYITHMLVHNCLKLQQVIQYIQTNIYHTCRQFTNVLKTKINRFL